MTYRQEYYEGEAEDAAVVLRPRRARAGPVRATFRGALLTKDFTPLRRGPGVQALREGCRTGLVLGVSGDLTARR